MGQPGEEAGRAAGEAAGPVRWRFFRSSGFDQVRLETGAELLSLHQLDQKLWAALSCPVHGLEFDSRTAEFMDTGREGRIRVPEVLEAVKWIGSLLKNPNDLLKGQRALPLEAIDDATEEGRQLLASAKQILKNLGKADATSITVEDTVDTARIFAKTRFNGDGVVPPESTDDPVVAGVMQDIIACIGSQEDRSGLAGISQAESDQFYEEIQAYAEWMSKQTEEPTVILPLGEATPSAAEALRAVRSKIDDFFLRCRLTAFDPKASAPLNPSETDYAGLCTKDLTNCTETIAAFPLAACSEGCPLPLREGINPAWAVAMKRLDAEVVRPLLGEKESLGPGEWEELEAKFAPYEAWAASKAGAAVEKLGFARVREILAGRSREAIEELLAQDKALEPEAAAIASVERLVRYYRDLYTLLNNFVSFRDFYTRKAPAVFQAGTLYLDGRSCELCVRVEDPAKHGSLAHLSRTFLAYCDCTRNGTTEKMTIAAAFTDGDSDHLMVGRNGVFYDRQAQAWDATITKIIDHPISLRQAFWAPYKKVARLISEQAEKLAAARAKASEEQAAKAVADASANVDAGKAPPAPPAPFDVAKFAGIFAAVGLALGAIGTALAAVLTGFLSLKWWQMPLAPLGLVAVISGFSVLLAWFKLRQRSLAPILDATGWAVNTQARINIPFGASLTGVAKLPPGSERSLVDPYAEKKARWPLWVLIAAVVLAAAVLWSRGGFGG